LIDREAGPHRFVPVVGLVRLLIGLRGAGEQALGGGDPLVECAGFAPGDVDPRVALQVAQVVADLVVGDELVVDRPQVHVAGRAHAAHHRPHGGRAAGGGGAGGGRTGRGRAGDGVACAATPATATTTADRRMVAATRGARPHDGGGVGGTDVVRRGRGRGVR